MKNLKTILGISAVSLLFTSSAFAADNNVGGSYTVEGNYSYDNWVTGDAKTNNVSSGKTFDNFTIGAGSTYTFSTSATLSAVNIYLYGNEDATASLIQGTAGGNITVSNDMIFNYGSYSQSAKNFITVNGTLGMYNASTFTILAGTLSTNNFYVTDTSVVNVNGSSTTDAQSTVTVTGTLTLADTAAFNVSNTNSASSVITLNNVLMQDSAIYTMSKAGTLTVKGAFKMTGDSVFSKTAGTLTFATGSSLSISDSASFSSNATTINGIGTLSLVVNTLVNTDGNIIEGSIDLGTVTLGSAAAWMLSLDITEVESSLSDELSIALSDFITMTDYSDFTSKFEIELISNDKTSTEYSASFDSTDGINIVFTYIGTAVPEPSTYAMILGAFALGFAYYRRRK